MTLHVLQTPSRINDCLSALGTDDNLLLIDRAVLLAQGQRDPFSHCGQQVFCLEADMVHLGLTPADLVGNLQVVDFDGWVALTEVHSTQMVWR